MSHPSDPSQNPASSQSQPLSGETKSWSAKNFESTFKLIDSLIPKASCTYHQILPLSLVEKCLTLGMVNLKNTVALDYVRSLLPSEDYSLKIQPLDSKTLQLILSAHAKPDRDAQLQAELATSSSTSINEQPTLIVDCPEELSPDLRGDRAETSASPSPNASPSLTPSQPIPNFNEQPTLIVDNPEALSPGLGFDASTSPASPSQKAASQPSPNIQPSRPSASDPSLEVQAHSNSESANFWASLTPQKLWQELLSRVLSEGIGRLYFERHPDRGRIFWSKNGVLQLSLEKITPSMFQGAIDEFKRLVQLPLGPVQQAKKGEIERYYRQERLLMRWQIIPGKYGEEGTIQVLRGKASDLYQQRQMDELGNQALQLADNLEKKLKQIQSLSRINPMHFNRLSALRQLQDKIERHLEILQKYQDSLENKE
jgi:type II secretory ATPase GspE/PulE/Tfp pilus assembly ATPase PilB-like protein